MYQNPSRQNYGPPPQQPRYQPGQVGRPPMPPGYYRPQSQPQQPQYNEIPPNYVPAPRYNEVQYMEPRYDRQRIAPPVEYRQAPMNYEREHRYNAVQPGAHAPIIHEENYRHPPPSQHQAYPEAPTQNAPSRYHAEPQRGYYAPEGELIYPEYGDRVRLAPVGYAATHQPPQPLPKATHSRRHPQMDIPQSSPMGNPDMLRSHNPAYNGPREYPVYTWPAPVDHYEEAYPERRQAIDIRDQYSTYEREAPCVYHKS